MENCISKTELARRMGVSPTTAKRYIRTVQKKLPHYNSRQKVLTPDQYEVIREHFCIT